MTRLKIRDLTGTGPNAVVQSTLKTILSSDSSQPRINVRRMWPNIKGRTHEYGQGQRRPGCSTVARAESDGRVGWERWRWHMSVGSSESSAFALGKQRKHCIRFWRRSIRSRVGNSIVERFRRRPMSLARRIYSPSSMMLSLWILMWVCGNKVRNIEEEGLWQ